MPTDRSTEEPALSPALFAQIKAIQLRTQRLVSTQLAGNYESAFKGRGMEFEQVRAYLPGDDIRHIDWNVTARLGSPHIKQHREERELTVILLVDVSASGNFGSAARRKREIAAELAAVLAYTAIRSNDRVGLIAFTDVVERYVPAKKGRAHVWRVIREVLAFTPRSRGTRIAEALEYLSRVESRRAVVFLISDFQDEGFAEALRVAARRHELTALHVVDPRELTLPRAGLVTLRDAETGRTAVVDTSDARVRERYDVLARKRRDELLELWRQCGVDALTLHTDEPYIERLVRFFREHQR